MRPYRVPDAFKPELDCQMQEFFDKRLVRPSNSPMASPIVCVAKKDGSVRIACDYRYLNSFTDGDAYPMPTIDDAISVKDSTLVHLMRSLATGRSRWRKNTAG